MNPNSVATPANSLLHDVMPPYASGFNKNETRPTPAFPQTPTEAPVAVAQESAVNAIPVAQQATEPASSPMFPEAPPAAQNPAPEPAAAADKPLPEPAKDNHQTPASFRPKTNRLVVAVALIIAAGLAAAAYVALKSTSQI